MIYGCPIWGLPSSNMCLYLDNIPNNIPVLLKFFSESKL